MGFLSNKFFQLLVVVGTVGGTAAYLIHGFVNRPPVSKIDFHPEAQGLIPTKDLLSSGDPCKGKPKCLIVYVAPWCPGSRHVHQSILSTAAIWQSSPEFGVRLISGADKPEAVRSMASTSGKYGYFTDKTTFYKTLNVNHYPAVFLVETESGKVLKHDRSAISWLNDRLNSR